MNEMIDQWIKVEEISDAIDMHAIRCTLRVAAQTSTGLRYRNTAEFDRAKEKAERSCRMQIRQAVYGDVHERLQTVIEQLYDAAKESHKAGIALAELVRLHQEMMRATYSR